MLSWQEGEAAAFLLPSDCVACDMRFCSIFLWIYMHVMWVHLVVMLCKLLFAVACVHPALSLSSRSYKGQFLTVLAFHSQQHLHWGNSSGYAAVVPLALQYARFCQPAVAASAAYCWLHLATSHNVWGCLLVTQVLWASGCTARSFPQM
jgi:hypothetical protein